MGSGASLATASRACRNDWPERKRRRINDFYRECVRRQLYLNGPDKTHLSKNPLWAGRVASLIESFPDARFVVNVRDPRDTIPSLLKLLSSAWQRMGWDEAQQQRCLGRIPEGLFPDRCRTLPQGRVGVLPEIPGPRGHSQMAAELHQYPTRGR